LGFQPTIFQGGDFLNICQTLVKKHVFNLARKLYGKKVEVEFIAPYKIKERRKFWNLKPRYSAGFIEIETNPPKITFDKNLFTYSPIAIHFWHLILHEVTHLKEQEHDQAFLQECELNKQKAKDLGKSFIQELKAVVF